MSKELLNMIKRQNLIDYMISFGWKLGKNNNPNYQYYTAHKNRNRVYSVLIPISDSEKQFRDMRVLEQAIEVIAAYSNIEESELLLRLTDIKQTSNMISFRISDAKDVSSHSLINTIVILNEVHDYLMYTAESLLPKNTNAGTSSKSRDFMQKCKMSHTTRGSFGLTIEIPLTIPSFRIPGEEIFEHSVSELAVNNIAVIHKAIVNDEIDKLLDKPPVGICFNTCKALLGILDNLDENNNSLTCSLLPSAELMPDDNINQVTSVSFEKEYSSPLVNIIEALRPINVNQDKTTRDIKGDVLGLMLQKKKSEIAEEVPDFIKLRETQSNKIIRIVKPTSEDYWEAHSAQLERKQIAVSGILEQSGNFAVLKNYNNLYKVEQ